ncbi:MAG: LemA family protein [Atopobiaceae bacterium]|jgi:LemA protein
MALIIVLIVIAVVAIMYAVIYNGIVSKNNKCDNAFQTIDAQLQRRCDLIPNLVETVKGYTDHESDTLKALTASRATMASGGTPQERIEASDQLTGALSHLFAVAENYPDLKASANFQQLQSDLSDTENKLSYARMSFNDCVLEYNNAIQTFPGNLVAGSKFQPRQGFSVTSDAVREAPKVKF